MGGLFNAPLENGGLCKEDVFKLCQGRGVVLCRVNSCNARNLIKVIIGAEDMCEPIIEHDCGVDRIPNLNVMNLMQKGKCSLHVFRGNRIYNVTQISEKTIGLISYVLPFLPVVPVQGFLLYLGACAYEYLAISNLFNDAKTWSL